MIKFGKYVFKFVVIGNIVGLFSYIESNVFYVFISVVDGLYDVFYLNFMVFCIIEVNCVMLMMMIFNSV